MEILNFIKALLPRLDRNDILEDIRITKAELDNGVIPNYGEAARYFNDNKIKSVVIKDMSTSYYKLATTKHKENTFVQNINVSFGNIKDNLTFIETELENVLEKDIIADGLTAKKTVLVRAAEHISFITRYSMDLLNYIYNNESIAYGTEIASGFAISEKISRDLEKNFNTYVRLLNIYAVANKDFVGKYKNIPEVVINATNFSVVTSTFKERDIDPYNGLVQHFEANPIYHFRLMIAGWQDARYTAFKDKKRMLELNLMNLRMQQDKTPDPKVEKEIIYLQDRIETIAFKMHKMEDSVK